MIFSLHDSLFLALLHVLGWNLEGTLGTGADLHPNGCSPMMVVAKGIYYMRRGGLGF